MSNWVSVKFSVPGLHHWPDAPEHLSYLRETHKHDMEFEVSISVSHDDREIEFAELKRTLLHLLLYLYPAYFYMPRQSEPVYVIELCLNFGPDACERIAGKLSVELRKDYPQSGHCVIVSEDGIDAAKVTYGSS